MAPLFTDNIDEARTAYGALEERAQAADDERVQLRASLDALRARLPTLTVEGAQLRQSAISQAARYAELSAQQATAVSPDIRLDQFIAGVGLAAALGEATMPDRAIPSVSCTLRAFVAVQPPAGAAPQVALRFHQPELGSGAGLCDTTFEIQRIPPGPGATALPNLYSVLADKQQLYAQPAWQGFAPAATLMAAATGLLAAPQDWTLGHLAATAGQIGADEGALAGLIRTAAPDAATALAASAAALVALAGPLQTKPSPVAGDLLALTAALFLTSKAARSFAEP